MNIIFLFERSCSIGKGTQCGPDGTTWMYKRVFKENKTANVLSSFCKISTNKVSLTAQSSHAFIRETIIAISVDSTTLSINNDL